MALNAHLGADFGQFETALERVELKLKDSAQIAANTGRDLSKMVEGFRGTDLQRQAMLAAEGIDRIGGVSRLTNAEQDRALAKIREALQKYQQLGAEAPPELQKMYGQLVNVTRNHAQLNDTAQQTVPIFGQIGGMVASAFSAAAVVQFARELMNAADQVQNLADRTQMGATEVQRLQSVQIQTGVSTEAMASAVQNLQQRLGSGDDGASGAMRRLGINTADFMAMRPYEQFQTLAVALGGMADQNERAKLASDLFGKAWKELTPALKQNFAELADSTIRFSDGAVSAMDRVGDRSGVAWQNIKNILGLMAMSVPLAIDELADSAKTWDGSMTEVEKATSDALAEMEDLARGVDNSGKVVGRAAKAIDGSMEQIDQAFQESAAIAVAAESQRVAAIEKSNARILKAVGDELAARKRYRDETAQMQEEALRLEAERTGTVTEYQIGEIGRWRDAKIAAAREAGIADQAYYDALEAVASEKLAKVEQATADASASIGSSMGEAWRESAGAASAAAEQTVGELERIRGATEAVASYVTQLSAGSSVLYDLTTNYGRALIEQMNPGVTEFLKQGYSIEQAMKLLMAKRYNYQVDVGAPDGNPWVPRRAMGGPVMAGQPYMVGELGPELFVPRQSGSIVPNGAAAGAVSVVISPGAVVLNYPLMNDPRAQHALAAVIGDAFIARLRGQNVRLAGAV